MAPGQADGAQPEQETVEFERWIIPEQSEALAGLLGIPAPSSRNGDALPPLWHWIYMTPRPPQNALGVDGHPRAGIPAPPGPGHVRMFAGGRVTTHVPLQFGRPANTTTRLMRSVKKQGKSGPLIFATTRSEIRQNDSLSIVEEQDIVYRQQTSSVDAPAPGAGRARDAGQAPSQLEMDVDSVALFRFSALTYNAHRIHYDVRYAKSEGYPDLVVHGPLQALLMSEAFRRQRDDSLLGMEFAYRLIAPTFGSQRIKVMYAPGVGAETASMRVFDERGVQTASSTVRDRRGR